MNTVWLNAAEFSDLVGSTRQVANRLLRQFVECRTKPLRDAILEVTLLQGQRAAAGRAYKVALASLPRALRDQLNARKTPIQLALPFADGDGKELAWLLHYVQPFALLDTGSARKRLS